jgi:hypothetical protein
VCDRSPGVVGDRVEPEEETPPAGALKILTAHTLCNHQVNSKLNGHGARGPAILVSFGVNRLT